MTKKLLIETHVKRLVTWLQEIESGSIQTPEFQRDFVWNRNDIKELFDSIKNGYPIGSVLLWKPLEEEFKKNNTFGPYYLNTNSSSFSYILDGFQRMSALFGCLTNPNRKEFDCNEDYRYKKFNLYYDLKEEEFIFPRSENSIEVFQVPVYELINTKAAFSFQNKLIKASLNEKDVEDFMERYSEVGTSFIDYSLPAINITGGDIQEAVEIFSRVNSKGTQISADWMLSALAYDQENNFRLGTLIDQLIDNLRIYNFDGLSNIRNIIIQCISNSFGKSYLDQKIESLIKLPTFISKSKKTLKNIEKAVNFLYTELLVVDSKLLPYGPQLVFITDFFNNIPNPSTKQIRDLKIWFWVTSYSNYFTIYSISKQRKAYNIFQDYFNNKSKSLLYIDNKKIKFQSADFPIKVNSGSVRSNALTLFLLNTTNDFQPISVDLVKGFILKPLIKDIKDPITNNYSPSNLVPTLIMDGDNRHKKYKDSVHLLEISIKDKYFITDDMSKLYDNKEYEKVINKRKDLIIQSEKHFVEALHIIYT